MKFYELDWGLYPRRVSIYLEEKGITDIERIAFDALDAWPPPELGQLNPAGTVPILQTEDGTLIRSSIAILEYLEEQFPIPDMLGATGEERARTRELVSIIDEATSHFVVWCREASPLFAVRKEQSYETATNAANAYYGRLQLLDTIAQETEGSFLSGSQATIADCIAMATLQFAEHFYGVPVPENCQKLSAWYAYFASRTNGRIPNYPEPLRALAYGLLNICPPDHLQRQYVK